VANVTTNTQALKVTLVWTEPPAAAGAAAASVNDLNLTVTSPDGTQVFLGNIFAGGVSTAGGAADGVNNVEMVLVNNPAPGNWTATERRGRLFRRGPRIGGFAAHAERGGAYGRRDQTFVLTEGRRLRFHDAEVGKPRDESLLCKERSLDNSQLSVWQA